MTSLLIDFESTGLDPEKDRIIEVGAILVDEEWTPIQGFTQLIWEDSYSPISKEIEKLTGIDGKFLEIEGIKLADAFKTLGLMVDSTTEYVIAYNCQFDKSFFYAAVAREPLDLFPGINLIHQLPWLCAMYDVEKNYNHKCWKLSHLALDHGLAVDPTNLHRAFDDVELMRKMLEHIGETPKNMHKFSQEPWAYLRAVIPPPWESPLGVNEAKKLGYSYEKVKGDDVNVFSKAWVKRVKERFVDDEIKKASFKVRRINTFEGKPL